MSNRYWFSTNLVAVNKIKLHHRLGALGFQVEGVADRIEQEGSVGIDIVGELTQQDKATIQSEIDAHDPTDYEALRQEQAESDAAAIPGYASWTEQEMLDYIEANVTNLASAKTVLKAMGRMIVALRNKAWPGLEGSD